MSSPLWLQFSSSDGYFQQHNVTHVTMSQSSNHLRLVSWTWQWVHFTQMASTVTDLNPIEHHWDVVEREIRIMDVQPTNLQQLCDAIMSIWTKFSEECFQYLVESMPRIIKAVLKAKEGPTQYLQGVPNKVASECIRVCVCVYAHNQISYYFMDYMMKYYSQNGGSRLYIINWLSLILIFSSFNSSFLHATAIL